MAKSRDNNPVYGAPEKSGKKDTRNAPSGVVGVREVLAVFGVAGVFIAIGYWQVNTVFTMRDYQMETVVVAQEAMKRRDKSRDMAVKIGSLQTDDSMRHAALVNYGMVDPDPALVTKVKVDAEAVTRWKTAGENAANVVAKLEEGNAIQSKEPRK
jgi:hypothetical protein